MLSEESKKTLSINISSSTLIYQLSVKTSVYTPFAPNIMPYWSGELAIKEILDIVALNPSSFTSNLTLPIFLFCFLII